MLLVTEKKLWSPVMSFQFATIPRSLSSGISERKISAPPPYGVAFTSSTRTPRKGAASSRSCSTRSAPALAS